MGIKSENIVMTISRPFIQLTMKANGKADLYFHAHFWEKYVKTLQDTAKRSPIQQSTPQKKKKGKKGKKEEKEEEEEVADKSEEEEEHNNAVHAKGDVSNSSFMKRLQGLSQTLSKVIVNIKKFPFNQKMYNKYVAEFGNRQTVKKMKCLEEIQRALFVSQIADDQEGLFWIEKILIQLQGYCDKTIRDQAIVLLNMLYDGVDWQL